MIVLTTAIANTLPFVINFSDVSKSRISNPLIVCSTDSDMVSPSFLNGRTEGRADGEAEGRADGRLFVMIIMIMVIVVIVVMVSMIKMIVVVVINDQ